MTMPSLDEAVLSCPFGPNESGHIKWIYDRIKTLPVNFILGCAIRQIAFAGGLCWFCRSLTYKGGSLGKIVGPRRMNDGLQTLLMN